MSDQEFSDEELLGYLEETLGNTQVHCIEQALRDSETLRIRASELLSNRDSDAHLVSQIWRRFRVSCIDRNELGRFLLGAVGESRADYIQFHLEIIGCRLCIANMADLEQSLEQDTGEPRRTRCFESSAGFLTDDEASTVE